MLIKVAYEIAYEVWAPTPMVLMLFIHPSRLADIRKPEQLKIEPHVPVEEFFDSFGNRCARIVAPPGIIRFTCDALVEDPGVTDPVALDAEQHSIESLPVHVLPYLLASRYCEVDKLSPIAWDLFSNAPTGWARVQAVCDWVHNHITFGYHFARSDKSAFDGYQEKQGVCRDFTHLAVAFCRGLGIPARYTTGYLGDIGVPRSAAPMDFSAWFEVYLGGKWHTFDARHNRRRIGRIVQARGRDATDVALTTTFGRHELREFKVWTDDVTGA
jgi:transglutaminase-like putative cysteine protease